MDATPTVECPSCSTTLDLVPAVTGIQDFAPKGTDFHCGKCGALISQLFVCSKCNLVNVVDLTSPGIRPSHCTCGRKIERKLTYFLTPT